MKILLIAGHGEGDPGACGNGITEADVNRKVVALLAERLTVCDVDVYPTEKNCYRQNKNGNAPDFEKYDYVLECHVNSSSNSTATGVEMLVHPEIGGVSVEEKILSNLGERYLKNRGVKYRDDLLNLSTCYACNTDYALLELGFISNKGDVFALNNRLSEMCTEIANGIKSGFALDTTNSTRQKLYHVQCGAYRLQENAKKLSEKLQGYGFPVCVVNIDGLHKVQCGAFANRDNADKMATQLRACGFETFVDYY